MERIRKEAYKGKEIVIFDYTGLNTIKDVNTIIEILDSIYPTLAGYQEKTALTITNVEGTFFNRDVLVKFKDAQAKINKILKKGAVVGIHGLQKIAFDAITAVAVNDIRFKIFNTEEAAKEWLAE